MPALRCKNPSCQKTFTPGHYGPKQKVCGAPACRAWYRSHWQATRRPPRGLSPEEFETALSGFDRDPLMRSLVIAARETGLRKGELLGLTWGDVCDGEKIRPVVEVRGQWSDARGFAPGKSRRSRLALFSSRAREALAEYRKALKESGHPPRPSERVWPVSESWVWQRWVDTQRHRGVKNPETGRPYRFHDLRHTLAIELARAGRLDLVKKMLDHKSLETSMIYVSQSPEDILEDVERVRRHHERN
jgi:integrase